MKRHTTLIIFILYLLNSIGIQSQDLIVNTNNDTIYCKILEMNDDNIRYQIQDVNRRITNTLNLRYISFYQINDHIWEPNQTITNNNKEHVFRFAFGPGYARAVGEIIKTNDPKLNQLNRDFVNGFSLEGDIEYYFNWKQKDAFHYGVALHFNYINHTASATNLNIPGFGYVDRYQESQIVYYVAPAFAMRYDLSNWLFTLSLGFGPVFLSNPMKPNYVQITGNTVVLGTHFGIGAEYKISPNWGIGIRLSEAGGTYDSINIAGEKVKLDGFMSARSRIISGIVSYRIK